MFVKLSEIHESIIEIFWDEVFMVGWKFSMKVDNVDVRPLSLEN